MGWFSDDSDQAQAYEQVKTSSPDVPISHELIAAAASFEAAKAYEDHVKANGKPANHALAKELLASITGAIVDREVEKRGIPAAEAEWAKHKAKREAHQAYDDGAPQEYKADDGY